MDYFDVTKKICAEENTDWDIFMAIQHDWVELADKYPMCVTENWPELDPNCWLVVSHNGRISSEEMTLKESRYARSHIFVSADSIDIVSLIHPL
jgi:hypothetical protein